MEVHIKIAYKHQSSKMLNALNPILSRSKYKLRFGYENDQQSFIFRYILQPQICRSSSKNFDHRLSLNLIGSICWQISYKIQPVRFDARMLCTLQLMIHRPVPTLSRIIIKFGTVVASNFVIFYSQEASIYVGHSQSR